MKLRRKCPQCGRYIFYAYLRSYQSAIKNESRCFACRQNEGIFEYTCKCESVIKYRRRQDYQRALRLEAQCSACHKRTYAKRHRTRVKASKSRWNRANKEYYSNKRMTDINYKIALALRIRVWQVLKGVRKAQSTIELLGCSVDELKAHLESKFEYGMCWENYGSYWEIDHIRPCASFDLTNPNQQSICFRYTNLQPLEKNANRMKGATYA